jgi:peptide/nickel transport system substrate-binding protein
VRAALVTLLVALTVLATGSSAYAKPANVVVFGLVYGLPGVLNPFSVNSGSVDLGPEQALRGAFVQNAKGVWLKDLVASATANKRGISYTIRPDAYWYWGGRKIPVTYHDFLYTLRQIDNLHNDVYTRAGYANLDPASFVHHGDRQVTFLWRRKGCSTDRPCAPYANWQGLFSQLLPSFALKGLGFDKIFAKCICGTDGKPVSDGPFYLARYRSKQGGVLKRNPFFYHRAKLAEIDLKLINDTALLAEAMRSGQIDATDPPFTTDLLALRGLPGITYAVVRADAFDQVSLRLGSQPGGPGVTKGSSNALLLAPWMRQAIALALDRTAMIKAVYGPGSGLKPDNSFFFFPGQRGYQPVFARWNHDPAAAIAILQKHCTGGPTAPGRTNTKVWQCGGVPALFRYTWPSTLLARTAIAQVAEANLRAVGIALTELPLPGSGFFAPTGVASGDFDLAEFAWLGTGDPGDQYDVYHCRGLSNWTGYCDHRVESLLKMANTELDPAKRTRLYQRADAIMAKQVPTIPLFQKFSVLAHKTALLGPRPTTSISIFWNVETWRWKR